MKIIIALSDTHASHRKIKNLPESDFLIHAGDFTWNGEGHILKDFGNWLRAQTQIKNKIIIAGNHEVGFQNFTKRQEKLNLIGDGFTYLEDSGVEIDGLAIYGTPWQPRFFNWEFNLDEPQLKEKFNSIPGALDILITHGPPKSVLDYVPNNYEGVGSISLLDRILTIKPRMHIFGHIHEGYGYKQVESINCINASFNSNNHGINNKPFIIKYDENSHELIDIDCVE